MAQGYPVADKLHYVSLVRSRGKVKKNLLFPLQYYLTTTKNQNNVNPHASIPLIFFFFSIAEKSIKVTLADGGDDTRKTLRRQLKKESTKTPNGASIRWAVAAASSGGIELQLQSLPLPASLVNAKPLLLQDNIAVNVVKSWPMVADVFDGLNGLSGPVPTLFGEEPEELRTVIEADHDSFFAELNKFMTR